MAVEQIFSVIKEYFPATLGAIIGAWNKRGEKNSIRYLSSASIVEKISITSVALFAITVGMCIGKWVSVALVEYYDIPEYIIPILEFVTALNGIKLVDSVLKGVDKSLQIVDEKLPKFVSNILDSIEVKLKKWFGG